MGGIAGQGLIAQDGWAVRLLSSGQSCTVVRLLGAGGQGEVYEVAMDGGRGPRHALKLYWNESGSESQYQILRRLVSTGAPDHRFLWPMDIAVLGEGPVFGYVMPVRDQRFVGLVDFLNNEVTTTFRALTTAGYQLADSFLKLHARGECYRDISYGNAFFDPVSGEILVCDNDNVTVDASGLANVQGTPRFMAPEIVRGGAEPSTRTDLFSLAVLLFYLLVRSHPLEGARETAAGFQDQAAFERLYGAEAVFIFDPQDTSNRPVPGVHTNAQMLWSLIPGALRDLFTQAFTAGLHNPARRVSEGTWKKALLRAHDSIAICECGAEAFTTINDGTLAAATLTCWNCSQPVPAPLWLERHTERIVLEAGVDIYPHHIGGHPYDLTGPVGRVVSHPSDPKVIGIQNISNDKWVGCDDQGMLHDVPPGRSIRAQNGFKIQFPRAEAIIRNEPFHRP